MTTHANDLARAEAILIAQAHTLDALFNTLARRSALNMGECMNAAETYLRLALKAQSQCRTTLQTLGELKYPRETAFIRQQNVAVNQQVNNHTDTRERTPAREKFSDSTNELLEKSYERVDLGTQDQTGAAHSTVETVAEVERTENKKR